MYNHSARIARLEAAAGIGVSSNRCPRCPVAIQLVDPGEPVVTHCPACGRPTTRPGTIGIIEIAGPTQSHS